MDVSKVRKKIKDLSLERFKAEMEMLRDLSRKKMLYGSVIKKYKACGKGDHLRQTRLSQHNSLKNHHKKHLF